MNPNENSSNFQYAVISIISHLSQQTRERRTTKLDSRFLRVMIDVKKNERSFSSIQNLRSRKPQHRQQLFFVGLGRDLRAYWAYCVGLINHIYISVEHITSASISAEIKWYNFLRDYIKQAFNLYNPTLISL